MTPSEALESITETALELLSTEPLSSLQLGLVRNMLVTAKSGLEGKAEAAPAPEPVPPKLKDLSWIQALELLKSGHKLTRPGMEHTHLIHEKGKAHLTVVQGDEKRTWAPKTTSEHLHATDWKVVE